jgi:AcrR family transcriptional regulator
MAGPQEARLSLVDQQMAERRERILEAARQLIEKHGFEGFTMRQLAGASRVTAPTLYNLVGNKEQVLFAAVEEQTLGFVAALERSGPDLMSLVDATVRQLLKRPRYYRALVLVLVGSESADPARRHVERALAKQIEAAITDLDANGALVDWVDRTVLARQLHSHLDMISLEWARGLHTPSSFRASARYGVATTLLGLSTGESRADFERIARDSQSQAHRMGTKRGQKRTTRGHAA